MAEQSAALAQLNKARSVYQPAAGWAASVYQLAAGLPALSHVNQVCCVTAPRAACLAPHISLPLRIADPSICNYLLSTWSNIHAPARMCIMPLTRPTSFMLPGCEMCMRKSRGFRGVAQPIFDMQGLAYEAELTVHIVGLCLALWQKCLLSAAACSIFILAHQGG